MIRLKNIIELIQLVWRSKEKNYILIYDKSTLDFKDYASAKKKGIELLRTGETQAYRIALELSFVDLKVTVQK